MACTACNYLHGCLCRGAVSSSILYVGFVISFQSTFVRFNLVLAIYLDNHIPFVLEGPHSILKPTLSNQLFSTSSSFLFHLLAILFGLFTGAVDITFYQPSSPAFTYACYYHLLSPRHVCFCCSSVPIPTYPPLITYRHLLSPRHVGLCCTCRSCKSSWGRLAGPGLIAHNRVFWFIISDFLINAKG